MSRRVLYRLLFKLVLTRIDAERTHELGLGLLRVALAAGPVRALARRLLAPRDPALRIGALGLDLPSPLGVAAGFDKGASAFEQLAALGFGFVEIGTVTAQEQPGNERPRIVRLPRDRALVNRMGFPNPGAPAVAGRLARRRGGGAIVGVNVGKTKRVADDEIGADYRDAVRRLTPGADYLVLNVSSPNTPGLRAVQTVDRLRALIAAARPPVAPGERRVPVLVKIAPDLADADVDAIADLAVELELDGIVAVNTTIARDGLSSDAATIDAAGGGGLSGSPLQARALEVLRRLHARAGDRLVLISVGGIETPDDALDRIRAGATLVQAYTGFAYGGPLWPWRMNRVLGRRVRETGARSVAELVGTGGGSTDGPFHRARRR